MSTVISWVQYGYDPRNDLYAKHLGGTVHYIYYGQHNNLIQTPFRYLVQAWKTWRVLCKERPDIIIAQNPPIFCVMVVFIFAKVNYTQYIIDSHTGAFLSRKWRWSLGLHRLLSRQALTTIVHNSHQENIVKEWGCRYLVLSSVYRDYPEGEKYPLTGQFNVAVIGSAYDEDQCLDVVFKAAKGLSDVCFYITGNYDRIPSHLLTNQPINCKLTGYLPDEQYVGLLREVDAIISLTTSNHTVLAGGYEAVGLGTPLITSDWPILKEYYPIGTVHIPNTVEGIYKGIRLARREHAKLKQDILHLQKKINTESKQGLRELLILINSVNQRA